MRGLSAIRKGGLLLWLGAAFFLFGVLFLPGGFIVAPSDEPLAMGQTVETLADNATWTHITSEVYMIGVALLIVGMTVLWRVAWSNSFADGLVRVGLGLSIIALIALFLAASLNHIIVHTIVHGEQQPIILKQIAATIQTAKAGIKISGGFVYALGIGLHGLGLWFKLSPGAQRVFALIFAIVGAATFVTLVLSQHFHGLIGLIRLTSIAGILIPIWYVALGTALYKEHEGFTLDSEGS